VRRALATASWALLWLAVVGGAAAHRVPVLVGARWYSFTLILLAGAAALLVALRRWRRSRRSLALLSAVAFGASLALLLGKEARFQLRRHRVLAAPDGELRRHGASVVVGYRDLEEVRALVARGAVAGVYVSRRNAQGRSSEALARELNRLQEARRERGLPSLRVFADQEGGLIEHLSPPLAHRPPLASLLVEGGDPERAGLAQRVRDYGRDQGRELRAVGVTHDLAPVVDLRTQRRPGIDVYSRIADRAIAPDPQTVARVAGWYCEGLSSAGVGCTLKHFPGLGKSAADTHFFQGRLDVAAEELRAEDLAPFALLAASQHPPAAVIWPGSTWCSFPTTRTSTTR